MSVITLRVPDLLRQRMARVKINWSEYIREAISEALESDTKRALIRKVQQLRSGETAPAGTATSIIRAIRDHE